MDQVVKNVCGTLLVPALVAALLITFPSCSPDTRSSRPPDRGTVTTNEVNGLLVRMTEIDVKGITLNMVWIPAGTFTMGSPHTEADRYDDERQHEVTLSRGFWLGQFEVTQELWERVMRSNISWYKGADRPAENVSWDDSQVFIEKLNRLVRGGGFRLPTEAEWEYACRAGTTGSHAGMLDAMAWYGGNAGGTTQPVGTKQPNAWGLYDMHGNVWEWCQDWFGEYPGEVTDPSGPPSGSNRVYRGGCWFNRDRDCRSALRWAYHPSYRDYDLGFRLARTVP